MKTLYEEIRTTQNLTIAWKHVKKSALHSASAEIRAAAAEFDHTSPKNIRKIQEQLRSSSYNFGQATGVLKDKAKREALGKSPRPIVISPIHSRVVQRAILQVLQPRKLLSISDPDSKSLTIKDVRIGKINQIISSPFGVGGLVKPYGGSRPAIALVSKAMESGAKFYYQSDIKAFFTDIPIASVADIVRNETSDERLVEVFCKGMEVDLLNKDELLKYSSIFPSDGKGVAQGSSLSALAGNILLYDLDVAVNALNVTAVRYIDDILMVSSSRKDLEQAISMYESGIESFGFSLYKPSPHSEKASQGDCADGFSFLGYSCQPNRVVPSSTSFASIKNKVANQLQESRNGIRRYLSNGQQLKKEHSVASTLYKVNQQCYGWQKSFNASTDNDVFLALENYLVGAVEAYSRTIGRYMKRASGVQMLEVRGIMPPSNLFK